MTVKRKFRCAFCEKVFTRKSWYEKHMCDKKKRFLDRNNINKIKAHRLFNHWQRRTGLLRRGKEKTFEEFCKSPYYNTFVNLVEFTNREYVVSSFKYIDWLVEHNVPEKKWFNERGLEKYRDYLRKAEDPEYQAKTSCQNIEVWCEDNDVPIVEFFSRIQPGQALNMVRENKLSPWVLFSYNQCLEELTSRFDGEVLFTLNEHINVSYWLDKVQRNRESSLLVDKLCRERLE